jgi:cystathionine gamma-synthase
MALPLWRHVVGYEEKQPEVMSHLRSGYPRFVIHPLIQEVVRAMSGGDHALPFPSRRVAEKCAAHLRKNGAEAAVNEKEGLFAVTTNPAGAEALKAFWQHTGLIVSTRQAEWWLDKGARIQADMGAPNTLRQTLARFYECEPSDVFLQPSGMAAQFAALEILQSLAPGLPTAQLGFPYVDTLKLQQKFGAGGILLHHLESLDMELETLLASQPLAGCFCEVPGNPLLGSANLGLISPILRRRGLPLVVDDVVATPYNIDLGPYADLIATSLTKFVAGTGEAMGGALICNPRSPMHPKLKQAAEANHEELLWRSDAAALYQGAIGFPERMRQHNAAGLFIAEKLRAHPAVEKVWYPKWEFSGAYEGVRRPGGGWGALVTFMPADGPNRSPEIYDRLELCKGPSLGTVFTLACPFTLLAHYSELDWAESCGVNRFLIRLSVGLEEPEEIWSKLQRALEPSPMP